MAFGRNRTNERQVPWAVDQDGSGHKIEEDSPLVHELSAYFSQSKRDIRPLGASGNIGLQEAHLVAAVVARAGRLNGACPLTNLPPL